MTLLSFRPAAIGVCTVKGFFVLDYQRQSVPKWSQRQPIQIFELNSSVSFTLIVPGVSIIFKIRVFYKA